MPKEPGVTERNRRGWKVLLGLGVAAPVLVGVALLPPSAGGGQPAAAHVHGASDAKVQVQLAQVRAATARFHRVERGGRGRLRARLGERRRREDRRGLCLAPDGGGDGLPLLQQGPDGRQRRQRPRAGGPGLRTGRGRRARARRRRVGRAQRAVQPGRGRRPRRRCSGCRCTSWCRRPDRPSTSPTPGCGRTTRPACSPTGTPTSTADRPTGSAGGRRIRPGLRTRTFTFAPLRMWCEGEGFGIGRESWCGWCGGAA